MRSAGMGTLNFALKRMLIWTLTMYRITKDKQNMSNGSHCVPSIPLKMSIQVCNQRKITFTNIWFFSLTSFKTFLPF